MSLTESLLSLNGGLPVFTEGSVPFAGVTGTLIQDNPNFFWHATNLSLGIGTVNPDSRLHIHKATAGVVTAFVDTTLTIENSDDCFLSILAPDVSEKSILFGEPSNNIAGSIRYNVAVNPDAYDFKGNGNVLLARIDKLGRVIGQGSLVSVNDTIGSIPQEGGSLVLTYGGNTTDLSKNFFNMDSVDNGVTDTLRIFSSDNTATTKVNFVMTEAGEITKPNNPKFFANKTVTSSNVTGDATTVTVIYESEIIDDGSNFAASTFTAPVAGRYRFSASTYLIGLVAGHATFIYSFVVSNRTVRISTSDPFSNSTSGQLELNGSILVDMDALDTAKVEIHVAGSTKTVDIFGNPNTNPLTWFSGELVG